jgi:hypothetical protein
MIFKFQGLKELARNLPKGKALITQDGFSAAEKQIAQIICARMTNEIESTLDRMEDRETELLAAR